LHALDVAVRTPKRRRGVLAFSAVRRAIADTARERTQTKYIVAIVVARRRRKARTLSHRATKIVPMRFGVFNARAIFASASRVRRVRRDARAGA